MAERPEIYLTFPCPPELGDLAGGEFIVHDARKPDASAEETLARVRAIVTNGISGADARLLQRFPALELVASLGIGVDAIDLDAARRIGVAVTNTPGVIADDVADLAMAMITDRLRHMREASDFLLAGQWATGPFPLARSLTGKRLGIVGLGSIGRALAARALAHRMQVRWSGPRPKPGEPLEHVPDLETLAGNSDVLAICCSGGAGTRHLVGRRVLEALGPGGLLVNVARGSIVDTDALVDCLQAGRLGGAALDVFEQQPQVPEALRRCERVLLTPHLGTATRETRLRMGRMVLGSLRDHFAGRPLQHRVA